MLTGIGVLVGLVALGINVAGPTFVAERIAATTLEFTSMTLADSFAVGPPPGGSPSDPSTSWGFTLLAKGTLTGLSPVGGVLASFPATLRFPPGGAAVATFTMPSLSASVGASNPVSLSVAVRVVDAVAFTAFGQALVTSPSVEASLSGTTSVSTFTAPGGLSITVKNVPFSKTISFPGANGLPGSNVTAFSLGRSNATTAIADITVALSNPSIVSIAPLGTVRVGVYFQGNLMGSVSAPNVTLNPGITSVAFSGILSPDNVTATDALISAYLGGGEVPVLAKGQPDASSSPLFAPVISALSLPASLSGAAVGAPPLIAGVYVDGMFLTPLSDTQVGLDLNVTVGVTNLLGPNSPITVSTVSLDCQLQGAGRSLGELKVPPTGVSNSSMGWGRGRRVEGKGAARMLAGAQAQDLPVFNLTIPISAILEIQAGDSAFSDFVQNFLSSETVAIGLVSSIGPDGNPLPAMTVSLSCALGDLSVAIPLDERTSVPGINGFPYVAVEVFAVTGESQPDPTTGGVAILTNLTVAILNPSPASFPLGANATLGIYAAVGDGSGRESRLGYSILYNKTLVPGLNRFDLVGVINPDKTDPSALPAASSLFSQYLGGLNASAIVKGEVVSLGPVVVTPAWLKDAVANISLGAVLPGLDPSLVPDLLVGVQALDLGLAFRPEAPDSPLFSGRVRAVLQLPFALAGVSVGSTNASLSILDTDTGGVIGTLDVRGATTVWYPCSNLTECAGVGPQPPLGYGGVDGRVEWAMRKGEGGTQAGLVPAGVLALSFPPTPLVVQDGPAFVRLVSNVLRQSTVTLRLQGSASPQVTTPVGNLSITGVGIDALVSVAGLANLTNPAPVVYSGDITNTSTCCLYPVVTFAISNPTALAADLGPVKLGVKYTYTDYRGVVRTDVPIFVTAAIPSLALPAGPSSVNLTSPGRIYIPLKGEGDELVYNASRELLSRFLCGVATDVKLVGLPDSSPYPYLAAALDGFESPANFPGIPAPLLTNGTLYIDALAVLGGVTIQPGEVVVTNGLSVTLTIQELDVTVFACVNESSDGERCYDGLEYGDAIGNLKLSPGVERPVSPPQSVITSPRYNITLLGSILDDIGLIIQGTDDGDSVTKVNGTISPHFMANVSGASEFVVNDIFFQQYGLKLFVNGTGKLA